MSLSNYKAPGVYINEINAFPNSVVPVATAVPAFIGYTAQASYNGVSYFNKPVKINSFLDFEMFFCLPSVTAPVKEYNPQYYLVKQAAQPVGNSVVIEGNYYSIMPDPSSIYYLYNSIRLFFINGGSTAYIVSVGKYGTPMGVPLEPNAPLINAQVLLDELTNGLVLLKKEQEPTMYICPDATLLSVENNGILMRAMLAQAQEMQTAICLFDIIGSKAPDPLHYKADIDIFRNNTGNIGLSYGAAYYPFIGTNIVQQTEIDYSNIFGGDIDRLAALINPVDNPNQSVAAIVANIKNPASGLTIAQNHLALLANSKTYSSLIEQIVADVNLLPPSGAMAGVINSVDNTIGVWKAPANVSLVGAVSLPIQITNKQQDDLNIDVDSGKSINVIRFFTGRGFLIWGARTLDGNSLEYRYISVRRTLNYIEQSCKMAARMYVFEPNTQHTWIAMKSVISNFLFNEWQVGCLQGNKPEHAFFVNCGLGQTMTVEDVKAGIMVVAIGIAMTRPEEFVIIRFNVQVAKE